MDGGLVGLLVFTAATVFLRTGFCRTEFGWENRPLPVGRAVVVNPKALVSASGGQRTDRPTAN